MTLTTLLAEGHETRDINPRDAVLAPLGWQFRNDLPPWCRDDPDMLAVLHACAREIERLEGAIEAVRRNLFPQTSTDLLGLFEMLLGLSVAPLEPIADRRALVLAYLKASLGTPQGYKWEEAVNSVIGGSWSYVEHDADDPNTPLGWTIRITLPGTSTSGQARRVLPLLRRITPAAWHIQVVYAGGFILDSSQLDLDVMRA